MVSCFKCGDAFVLRQAGDVGCTMCKEGTVVFAADADHQQTYVAVTLDPRGCGSSTTVARWLLDGAPQERAERARVLRAATDAEIWEEGERRKLVAAPV